MIKRVLCFLICFCLFFTFIACDGDKKQDTPATSSATTEAQTTEEPDDDGSSSGSKKPSKPQPSLSKATIKIGLSAPLSGPAGIYGTSVLNSAQMAIDEINSLTGAGFEFELILRDDRHDPANVPEIYASLMDDGMQVSLGGITTTPCREFASLSKEDNVFFITPSASGIDIAQFDNGYQMCISDAKQGTFAAKFFNEFYADKTIGIFYKADDEYYSGAIYNQFKAALDPSITTVEASFVGDAMDFTAQIYALQNCDVIFMPTYYTPAANFMLQSKYISNRFTAYVGCDGFGGIEYAEGFDITNIPQEISMLTHFNTKATDGPDGEFVQKYKEKYGEDTLTQFGASAYDCVYAIYDALTFAKGKGANITTKTSASDLCEILKGVFQNDEFVFRGITGACSAGEKSYITWNEDGTVSKNMVRFIIKAAD